MPAKTVLTDRELQQRSQCSMYAPTEIDHLEEPARQTIRWALRERAMGKIARPPALRERFVQEWNARWDGPKDGVAYWKGPNAARPFGRRVYQFLLKYEVLHPYEPFSIEFENGQVKGENALVVWRRYRQSDVPMVVDPLLRRPRYLKMPNYTVLAQWLAARQDVDDVFLGIVHQPMLSGERWLTRQLNEPLVKQWLNHLSSGAAEFPRTGPDCMTCSRPCSEVFDGPRGVNWEEDKF